MTQEKYKQDYDIVYAGWAGLEGTIKILHMKEKELLGRFQAAFLDGIRKRESELLSKKAAVMAYAHGAAYLRHVAGGGVLAALWEMAEESGTGLSIELDRINILQETIEVCEYYRLNPYQLTSGGSMLIFTERGNSFTRCFLREGIPAEVIGVTTPGNARIIRRGGEEMYLGKPAPDELTKALTSLAEN